MKPTRPGNAALVGKSVLKVSGFLYTVFGEDAKVGSIKATYKLLGPHHEKITAM